MKSDSVIPELIFLFKTISVIGFLASGAMIIGISYRAFSKIYGPKSEEKKGVFFVFSIFVIFVLLFVYLILF